MGSSGGSFSQHSKAGRVVTGLCKRVHSRRHAVSRVEGLERSSIRGSGVAMEKYTGPNARSAGDLMYFVSDTVGEIKPAFIAFLWQTWTR